MKQPTAAQIVKIGLGYPEIGNAEIIELFGISRQSATRMKNRARVRMAAENVRTWSPCNVNTRIAFEVWGLDVAQAEQALRRLQKLGLAEEST